VAHASSKAAIKASSVSYVTAAAAGGSAVAACRPAARWPPGRRRPKAGADAPPKPTTPRTCLTQAWLRSVAQQPQADAGLDAGGACRKADPAQLATGAVRCGPIDRGARRAQVAAQAATRAAAQAPWEVRARRIFGIDFAGWRVEEGVSWRGRYFGFCRQRRKSEKIVVGGRDTTSTNSSALRRRASQPTGGSRARARTHHVRCRAGLGPASTSSAGPADAAGPAGLAAGVWIRGPGRRGAPRARGRAGPGLGHRSCRRPGAVGGLGGRGGPGVCVCVCVCVCASEVDTRGLCGEQKNGSACSRIENENETHAGASSATSLTSPSHETFHHTRPTSCSSTTPPPCPFPRPPCSPRPAPPRMRP
jgi:hypothetical protein